jgi:enamine deaminase RidA (YjgF/YER057c/UK114 family)
MEYHEIHAGEHPVEVRYSCFPGAAGAGEYHAVFTLAGAAGAAARQLALLDAATRAFPLASGHPDAVPVWRRFHASDPLNLPPPDDDAWPGATSFTGQPPLGGGRVAAWCYYVDGARVSREGNAVIMTRPFHEHHYYTGYRDNSARDEAGQTRAIFRSLRDAARGRGLRFRDEMTRAWVYVADIDNRYAGMVTARREFFEEEGLTAATHYIASTGIEGKSRRAGCLVEVDAYAVKGLAAGQVRYLRALDRLCPTSRYGVTFERGTAIAYADREHLFISGTASIDSRGEILFPRDAGAQARRAIENVEALLRAGGATTADVTHAIVYARDAADYLAAREVVASRLPAVPVLYLHAAVCRPGWLVELECSAIVARRSSYPSF